MNSKKLYLSIALFCLLAIIFIPFLASAQGLVPCGTGSPTNPDGTPNSSYTPCGIGDFFQLLLNIYNFIVKMIAAPLAVIALIIGGVFMMISAGNPNLFGLGKKILYAAIIGLVLVFCSWIIINTVVSIIAGCPDSGAPVCSWSSISF